MTSYNFLARMQLFPLSTRLEPAGDGSACLSVAGCSLEVLAEQFGTPLYLYDQHSLDSAVEGYRLAMQRHYPGTSGLTYAGKAFLCSAVVQWASQQDLTIDCTGAGEIAIATTGGAPGNRILVHGVNKSPVDLRNAVGQAGIIVVDNLDELEQLAALQRQAVSFFPELWLRLRPGLAVKTHAYTQTGQIDSKFGLDFEQAAEAVQLCQQQGLKLTGLHFHQGSHFHDPAPLAPALEQALDFMVAMRKEYGWHPDTLCPGGGWGVAYHEDELPHPRVEAYVQFIAEIVIAGCHKRDLPLPHLQLEPGRSLVARAGVALYRVGAVKHTPGRRWLLLDGGMADNPRPALYQARYSALPVQDPDRTDCSPAWLGGPYCESGDILIENLLLPELHPGELIAVPISGAYHMSMSSNYNGALKPAVVWLKNGQAHMIQRRETLADLTQRDLPLPSF